MPTGCAVCKHRKNKCPANCLFAPYFPRDKMERFKIVRRFYGVKQLKRILNRVLPNKRRDAMNSVFLEAQRRHIDPVYGNPGVIFQLQRQEQELILQINNVRSMTNSFRSFGLQKTVNDPSSVVVSYGQQQSTQQPQLIQQPPAPIVFEYGQKCDDGFLEDFDMHFTEAELESLFDMVYHRDE